MSRTEALFAERVIRRDLLDSHTREMQEKGGQQSRPVLAAGTVDDDSPLGRVRDGSDRGGQVPAEVLEEDEIDVACGGRHVTSRAGRGIELGLDLLPLARVGLEERDVQDL